MNKIFYILILLVSTNVFAYDDPDGGEELYSCSAAIDIAMEHCALLDDIDQDHSYDESCITEKMESYGFTRSEYELEDNYHLSRPGYNDYVCSSDIPDYD